MGHLSRRGLTQRAQWPPHDRIGEGGSRLTISDTLNAPQKMDILRSLAGRPLEGRRRGH